MDKSSNDYRVFDSFKSDQIFFVMRVKTNALFESVTENDNPSYIDDGIIKDEVISVELKENGKYRKNVELRKVRC